jgi:hypothetical protein
MKNSFLTITDGTTSINLLDSESWSVKSWHPEMAQPKGGGIFRSSPLVDGRKLSMRKFDNAIESITMVVSSMSENRLIREMQELTRLLQKATEYWTSSWQNEPVWIEAQGPCEAEKRYAIIMDYRMSGFNNPYSQPFFNAFNTSAMDNIILSIERGHWQDVAPGDDGICAKVSSQYDIPVTVSNGTFRGSDSYDDVVYSTMSTILFPLYDYLLVGFAPWVDPTAQPYGPSTIGLRFDSLTIPQSSRIIRAILTMRASTTIGTDNLTAYIVGEDVDNAPDFNQTLAQFKLRVYYTARKSIWVIPPTVKDSDYSVDVTKIVQEIIDRTAANSGGTGWVNGNGLVLFVIPSGLEADELRSFYDYNAAPGQGASLFVEYTDAPETVGADATCDNEVYIGNKHNRGAITNVYYYDDSTATFSAELLGAATPFAMLPPAPAVDDCIYFGSCDVLSDYGPFFNLVFDIGTASADVIGVWEYYDSGTTLWTDLDDTTTGNWVCGNVNFIETGPSHVTFRIPPANVITTVNTVDGYWIRYRVTAVGAAPTPPTQDNGSIYTVLNPYIDIDELEVGGDIPAASRIIVDCGGCNDRRTSTLNIALRSLDRGDEFTAYLNVANSPPEISFQLTDATTYPLTVLEVSSKSPCGYVCETADVTASLTEVCYWLIDPTVATQYIGSYHAYLRLDQTTGAAGDVKLRLKATMGTGYNVNYSDANKTAIVNFSHAVDLGKLTVSSPFTLRPGDQPSMLKFSVEIQNPLGREIDIFDLVLFPTDEWMGTFSTTSAGLTNATGFIGKRYDIDNITNPRSYRATLTNIISDTEQTIDAELMRVASAPPMLQSNRDQRLWFFQTYGEELKAHFETISSIRIQRANRYLVMRGER